MTHAPHTYLLRGLASRRISHQREDCALKEAAMNTAVLDSKFTAFDVEEIENLRDVGEPLLARVDKPAK